MAIDTPVHDALVDFQLQTLNQSVLALSATVRSLDQRLASMYDTFFPPEVRPAPTPVEAPPPPILKALVRMRDTIQ